MTYRPEGWKNPNEEYYNAYDVPTVQDAEYEAYEAGADAMLEALRKEGLRVKVSNGIRVFEGGKSINLLYKTIGMEDEVTLVIIPADKEEKCK